MGPQRVKHLKVALSDSSHRFLAAGLSSSNNGSAAKGIESKGDCRDCDTSKTPSMDDTADTQSMSNDGSIGGEDGVADEARGIEISCWEYEEAVVAQKAHGKGANDMVGTPVEGKNVSTSGCRSNRRSFDVGFEVDLDAIRKVPKAGSRSVRKTPTVSPKQQMGGKGNAATLASREKEETAFAQQHPPSDHTHVKSRHANIDRARTLTLDQITTSTRNADNAVVLSVKNESRHQQRSDAMHMDCPPLNIDLARTITLDRITTTTSNAADAIVLSIENGKHHQQRSNENEFAVVSNTVKEKGKRGQLSSDGGSSNKNGVLNKDATPLVDHYRDSDCALQGKDGCQEKKQNVQNGEGRGEYSSHLRGEDACDSITPGASREEVASVLHAMQAFTTSVSSYCVRDSMIVSGDVVRGDGAAEKQVLDEGQVLDEEQVSDENVEVDFQGFQKKTIALTGIGAYAEEGDACSGVDSVSLDPVSFSDGQEVPDGVEGRTHRGLTERVNSQSALDESEEESGDDSSEVPEDGIKEKVKRAMNSIERHASRIRVSSTQLLDEIPEEFAVERNHSLLDSETESADGKKITEEEILRSLATIERNAVRHGISRLELMDAIGRKEEAIAHDESFDDDFTMDVQDIDEDTVTYNKGGCAAVGNLVGVMRGVDNALDYKVKSFDDDFTYDARDIEEDTVVHNRGGCAVNNVVGNLGGVMSGVDSKLDRKLNNALDNLEDIMDDAVDLTLDRFKCSDQDDSSV